MLNGVSSACLIVQKNEKLLKKSWSRAHSESNSESSLRVGMLAGESGDMRRLF